MVSKPEGD